MAISPVQIDVHLPLIILIPLMAYRQPQLHCQVKKQLKQPCILMVQIIFILLQRAMADIHLPQV
jgi:hypothetical protein